MFLDARLPDRFWSKVIPEPNSGCWLWLGAGSGGYGHTWAVGGRKWLAHRLAFEVLVGPVPKGLDLDHLCRNRGCCNPAHLEPVTHRENARRGLHGALITRCPSGHAYDDENTYVGPNGARKCRRCGREKAVARYQSKRATQEQR